MSLPPRIKSQHYTNVFIGPYEQLDPALRFCLNSNLNLNPLP